MTPAPGDDRSTSAGKAAPSHLGPSEKDPLDRWEERNRQSSGDKDDDDGKDDGDGKKKSPFANIWVKISIVVVVILLIVGGVIWWLNARHYEDTDDAFIDTHIVHISPQTAGQVIAVRVDDNQLVRQGQPLVEIDPSDAQARLAQAEAQRLQAQTQLAQARATATGTAAQQDNAARDLARYRALQRTAPAALAQQQFDAARATARNAAAQHAAAQAQIEGAIAQIKVDDAQIAAAKLTLSYTHIVAPVDGHVTQRTVAAGNYVAPGQELLTVVPLQLWVTANFKETQLADMRAGQHVTVSVDACAGADIGGHVQSIQRGAGQAFGILPPENATGNYVKVVQRVPVKIALDRVPKNCVLGPGMSVEPSVTVR